ncbi:uncharacterized protein DS421_19g638330 [Arachis hypogaea]|uniref:Knottin scorpion toxin-like domain-containing protein n=1 Tax=Arachis hypogaea TaxID=3818 RepID=A0A6B9V6G7_ARAHY|nr:uncharacterized protein DS421_19g638330 [Arachis hypogaea]
MAKLSMAKFFSLFLLVSVMRSEVGVGQRLAIECRRQFWYRDNCVREDCQQLCLRFSEPAAVAVSSECPASHTCFCQYWCLDK